MKTIIKLMWCIVVCAASAGAANYTVKAGGGGNYTTIQACATAVHAGDTCTIYAGTYNETPSLTTAGTSSGQITFTVNSGDTVQVYGFVLDADYNTINGFYITDPSLTHSSAGIDVPHSHTGDQITNNTITQVGKGPCIFTHSSAPSSYITIGGNTISWCSAVSGQSNPNPATAIQLSGDHFLVQNNIISHTTNGISGDQDHTIIRGNSYGPVNDAVDFPGCYELNKCDTHVDFIELIPSSSTRGYIVIENNKSNNLLGVGGAHGLGISEVSGTHEINRYNAISNAGSGYWCDNGTWTYVKDYNNTVSMIGNQASESEIMYFATSSTYGAVINNLYYDVMTPYGGTYAWYHYDSTSGTGFTSGHNLLYDSVCTTKCSYLPLASTDSSNVKGSDPLFVSVSSLDFHLQSGSPAIGTGTYLTTAVGSASSSTTLTVADAAYFQDGWGIAGVQPDWIRIGTDTSVQISSINYSTNVITVANPVTWSNAAPIYLYKDSSGNVVLNGPNPDIGAYQFGSVAAQFGNVASPTGLAATVQ
jgi:hypothetical protein